jgi:cytochrome P450
MICPMNAVTVPGHPILGHLRSFHSDRIGMQLRVGRAHDLAQLRLGFVNCLMVSAPALAQEVLSTKERAFVKAPGLAVFLKPVLGEGLLSSEGAFHTHQRKLLAPVFAHKRISSYAATMAERGAHFARGVAGGAELDVAEAMMRVTLEIVGKTLFDAEVGSDADAVGDAITTVMETTMAQLGSLVPLPPYVPSPANLRSKRAAMRLDEVVYRMIHDRRANPVDRGDLLSMLLAAQDEDGATMTDKQVRDESMTLFLAGHETTANAMAWTLYLLAKNPAARAKVEAEIDALGRIPSYEDLKELPYTLCALKEALRLYPPAYIIARRVVSPVTIGEHLVKKNTMVLVNILGIHRRADVWPDPEAYRPERFLGEREKQLPRCAYLPFGAGPRICIGNHFALMEGHVLLGTILRRLRFDLVSDAPVECEPLITLRPKGGVRMRATARAPHRETASQVRE